MEIALAGKSKFVAGTEMPPFFAAKLNSKGADSCNSMQARFAGSATIGGPATHGLA